jgi:hypothetical protein
MFDQTDMSCLNMTLHEHRPRALILTPMTLKQAVIIYSIYIIDSICLGNDFNLTKHIKIKTLLRIYTHLYTVSALYMHLSCGL